MYTCAYASKHKPKFQTNTQKQPNLKYAMKTPIHIKIRTRVSKYMTMSVRLSIRIRIRVNIAIQNEYVNT